MKAAATIFMEGVPPLPESTRGDLRHLAASFLLSCVRTHTYIRDSLIARESAAAFPQGAPTKGQMCPKVPQPQCPHCGRTFAAWHLAKRHVKRCPRARGMGASGDRDPVLGEADHERIR
jgi:hypothetical protein